jgi:thiol-disulfide isomerase/thioredoxin
MKTERRHFLTRAAGWGAAAALGQADAALAQSAGAAGAAHPSSAAAEAKAPPLPEVGTPLRLPQVALFDGTVFQPAQAESRVLVIYWWASTCPFCTLQSPEMQKLWQSQAAHGLQVLTLSVDRTPQEAQNYLKKKGYTFPAGFVTPEVHRLMPKPRGLPVTLVRGRDGRVLQAEKGQLFPEDVEQLARWL